VSARIPTVVQISEVGPRDGLQNEPCPIPTERKAAFVRALMAAGHREIEITSFVRPDRVPQLADADELCRLLGAPPEGVTFSALVPNERGLDRALATGSIGKVGVFTAASETFNQRNVNASIAQSIQRFRPVATQARSAGLALRGYVSVALGCPYEGYVPPPVVADVSRRLLDLGCEEISVGDTIGSATPADVGRLLDTLRPALQGAPLCLHFHDTRGMAVANTVEGLRHGVSRFDASSGGLGGCPFAPGAAGNLATEDLLFLLNGLGIGHGVRLAGQRAASRVLEGALGHALVSRVFQAPPWGEAETRE